MYILKCLHLKIYIYIKIPENGEIVDYLGNCVVGIYSRWVNCKYLN